MLTWRTPWILLQSYQLFSPMRTRGEPAAGGAGGGRGADLGDAGVGECEAQRAKCARREDEGASGEEPGPSPLRRG